MCIYIYIYACLKDIAMHLCETAPLSDMNQYRYAVTTTVV